ncbi:hypothetical protein CH375_19780 [Leptospira ellisii]|nr:hypothetical protein CH375_19780 [Leptospira ellisii]
MRWSASKRKVKINTLSLKTKHRTISLSQPYKKQNESEAEWRITKESPRRLRFWSALNARKNWHEVRGALAPSREPSDKANVASARSEGCSSNPERSE